MEESSPGTLVHLYQPSCLYSFSLSINPNPQNTKVKGAAFLTESTQNLARLGKPYIINSTSASICWHFLILIEKMKSRELKNKHGHQRLMFLFICHAKQEFQFTTVFLDIACS